jgi:taurine dioxygenase
MKLLDIYPRKGPRWLRRTGDGWAARPYELLTVRPMNPTIGAVIEAIDLNHVPDDKCLADELRQALLEWKVLVFRDQTMTEDQQNTLAEIWGDLVSPMLAPEANYWVRAGERLDAAQNYWHSDGTYDLHPTRVTVLQVAIIPESGGDTLFADMAAAYDNLDEGIKAEIDGLTATHDWLPTTAFEYEDLDAVRAQRPPVTHPVVRVHPETGRKTLYVNATWTQSIDGMDPTEGESLLLYLTAQATVPEYQFRVRWAPGTVVIWDNTAVQHYALSDYDGARRDLIRTVVSGYDSP